MIIGICGFIGSGKGTVGDILHHKYRFEKDSFARPLKDAAAAIFGWNRDLLEGDTTQSRAWREQPDEFWSRAFGRAFTPREALQKLGTEAGRNVFHPDIWSSSLIKRSLHKNIVITDVRFKNEVQTIRDHNGILIWVIRGEHPNWYEVALRANAGDTDALITMTNSNIHLSEWDWVGTQFDATIHNDHTLPDLERSVDAVIENLNYVRH